MASTNLSFVAAIEIFESSVDSYNWLTSLPPPRVQSISRHTPTINEVHQAIAALEEMAASLETAEAVAGLDEYPETDDDASVIEDSSLALRYVPTKNNRPPGRGERLKNWLRKKIRGSSRA